ncbi:hypothetical protein HHK36_020361 [Tetracentron sinense]|uniref:Uncharacterized protein n=1 Tax=Tetracentron sinense TaxID=13715 RepID=A0A834YV98_TETSI|nr:hypothetical protein HHK36_020361 [Tetracentron sinense]
MLFLKNLTLFIGTAKLPLSNNSMISSGKIRHRPIMSKKLLHIVDDLAMDKEVIISFSVLAHRAHMGDWDQTSCCGKMGKRTPRFPVSYSNDKYDREKYVSLNKQGITSEVNAIDNEVVHVHAQSEMTGVKLFGTSINIDYSEGSLGSMVAENGDYSRDGSYESSAFDALQTLADISLMMPASTIESVVAATLIGWSWRHRWAAPLIILASNSRYRLGWSGFSVRRVWIALNALSVLKIILRRFKSSSHKVPETSSDGVRAVRAR